MSIKVEHEGQEIEVLTPEEVAAITGAKDTEITTTKSELEKAKADLEKANRVIADKNENFKKYKDLSEEEKAKYSAGELEAKRQAEAAEERAAALEKKYNDDNELKFKTAKEAAIKRRVGDDKDLYEKVSKNWDMINITGTDDAVINQRADFAFNMAVGPGGKARNPLNQPLYGDMSGLQPRVGDKGFLESDKAKAAESAIGDVMGFITNDKK